MPSNKVAGMRQDVIIGKGLNGLLLSEEPTPYGQPSPSRGHRLTCVDLFSGCGGLSLGLEQAGFETLLFSEINFSAAQTHLANRMGRNIIPIGDIYQLTDENLELIKYKWRLEGIPKVDLVAGGPPCQGYSGIGHRRTFRDLQKKDIPSNHLYQEMARVIRALRPRAFLFENVRGLLTSRWSPEGDKGEVFRDVLAEFKSINGYEVRWELVQAKDYGVPQNRPRVIVVGVNHDVLAQQLSLFEEGAIYQTKVECEGYGPLQARKVAMNLYDPPTAIEAGFLPRPGRLRPPTLEELFSDIEDPDYASKKSTSVYPKKVMTKIQKELRTRPDGTLMQKGDPLTEQDYSQHAEYIVKKFAHMIANNGEIPEEYRTKKFAQRVFPRKWNGDGPNITACSLPEDYVHYSQPRSPTVREWARLQTFPDWYVFKGPRTTGGRRRAGDPDAGIWHRDVPRYTQIGNAVPVRLAREIGKHLAEILRQGGP